MGSFEFIGGLLMIGAITAVTIAVALIYARRESEEEVEQADLAAHGLPHPHRT